MINLHEIMGPGCDRTRDPWMIVVRLASDARHVPDTWSYMYSKYHQNMSQTQGADAAEQPPFTSITSLPRLFRNKTKSIWVAVLLDLYVMR